MSRLDAAYTALAAADGALWALNPLDRACVLADTAFGLIQNGGFERFFASDFPGHPSYADFAEAFDRMALVELASRFRQAVDAFRFTDPHLDAIRRRDTLASPSALVSHISTLNAEAWAIDDLDERIERVPFGA